MSLIEILQHLKSQPITPQNAVQQSWIEKLLTDWQSGAAAPQPQAYEPRNYPARPGVLPMGRR